MRNDDVRRIKAEIRQLRKKMKDDRIRTTSCFNGGLTQAEYACNNQLFRLKTELEQAQKTEWSVIVGNVGYVHSGDDESEARFRVVCRE